MTDQGSCAEVEWAPLADHKLATTPRRGATPEEDALVDAAVEATRRSQDLVTTLLGTGLGAACTADVPRAERGTGAAHRIAAAGALVAWQRRARTATGAITVFDAAGTDAEAAPTVTSHQVSVIDWPAVIRSGLGYELRHLGAFDEGIERLVGALARASGNPWSASALVASHEHAVRLPPSEAWTLLVPLAGDLTVEAPTPSDPVVEGSAALVPPGAEIGAPPGAVVLRLATSWPSLTDLVAHARQVARYWPRFRADLPYDLAEPARSYAGSVYDRPEDLRHEVDQLLDAEVVERFRAQRTLDLGIGLPAVELPPADTDPAELRWRYRPIGLPVVLDRNETSFTLGAGGQGITLPRHAVPALARVVGRDGERLADLGCPHHDLACDAAVRHGLQASGFLEPWNDPGP